MWGEEEVQKEEGEDTGQRVLEEGWQEEDRMERAGRKGGTPPFQMLKPVRH